MNKKLSERILAEMFNKEDTIPTPADYRTKLPDILGNSEFLYEKKFVGFMKMWSARGFSLEYDGRRDPTVCQRMEEQEKRESEHGAYGGFYNESMVMRFSAYSMRVNQLQQNMELYRRMGFILGSSDVDKPEDGYCEVINAVTVKYFSDHRRICFDGTTKEIYLYNNGMALLLDIDNNSDTVFLMQEGFTVHRDKYLSALYEMNGEASPEIDFASRVTDFNDTIDDDGGNLRLSYDVISCGELADRTMLELKLYVHKEACELSEYSGIRLVKSECGEEN